MSKISIVITSLNDNDELERTIQSILDTAETSPEIIVVDDGTQEPFKPSDQVKDWIELLRVEDRLGVGAARHFGASYARFKWLMIIDSHMRFKPGWDKVALEYLKNAENPNTLWCTTCLGLNKNMMDVDRCESRYHGAGINFYGPDEQDPNKFQIIEGVWLEEVQDKDHYIIPCVMGAAYFIPRDFFFFIGGLNQLMQYGSDEPFLSLKTWMAGGEVRLMKNVEVGHQFRSNTHFRNNWPEMIYNKLLIATTLFPEEASRFINDKLLVVYDKVQDVNMARQHWKRNERYIQCSHAWMQSIQQRSFEEFLETFDIPRFWT